MLTALIVQEDFAFRKSLRDVLCSRFPVLDVKEASDSSEALDRFEALKPDLVFIDLRLGEENGLELARRIKRARSEVPIIILTDSELAEYREAACQSGADHVIPKGAWTWGEIAGLVESILLKSGA